MPVVGITGHVHVPTAIIGWIESQLAAQLQGYVESGWQAVTCLAPGADQIFARAVLDLKGSYEVILPAEDYPQRMFEEGNGEQFATLLAEAAGARTMPYETSSREAYLAASRAMLDRCDLLMAVWDGQHSQQVGDTGDVVEKAKEYGIPVHVVWPLLPFA